MHELYISCMWRLLFRVTSTFPGSSCSAKQFKVLPARFLRHSAPGRRKIGGAGRGEERRGRGAEEGAGGGGEKYKTITTVTNNMQQKKKKKIKIDLNIKQIGFDVSARVACHRDSPLPEEHFSFPGLEIEKYIYVVGGSR